MVMGQSSSEAGTWESGGDDEDNQAGGEGSGGAGVSPLGSMRPLTRLATLEPRRHGLIKEMEEEVRVAGLGGWFNRMDQELLESWSGPDSNTSKLQG